MIIKELYAASCDYESALWNYEVECPDTIRSLGLLVAIGHGVDAIRGFLGEEDLYFRPGDYDRFVEWILDNTWSAYGLYGEDSYPRQCALYGGNSDLGFVQVQYEGTEYVLVCGMYGRELGWIESSLEYISDLVSDCFYFMHYDPAPSFRLAVIDEEEDGIPRTVESIKALAVQGIHAVAFQSEPGIWRDTENASPWNCEDCSWIYVNEQIVTVEVDY